MKEETIYYYVKCIREYTGRDSLILKKGTITALTIDEYKSKAWFSAYSWEELIGRATTYLTLTTKEEHDGLYGIETTVTDINSYQIF